MTGQTEQGDKISIESVSVQSNKKVLWKCKNDESHLWYTKIQKRTLLNSGCPYCKNQKFNDKSENNLKNWCLANNKNWIIEQFIGKDETGKTVDITQVGKASHKKITWKHITDDGNTHTWIAEYQTEHVKIVDVQYVTEGIT